MAPTTPPSPLHTPLTDLKGIGPAKASRIQQALHIEFAEALVGLTADDIFHRLAATGPQIPRREIQQWLIQALRLVKAHDAAAALEDETTATATRVSPAFNNATPSPTAAENVVAAPLIPTQASSPTGTFEIARVGDQLRIKYLVDSPFPAELTTADPGTLFTWVQAQLVPAPKGTVPESVFHAQWRIEITRVEVMPLDQPDSPQPAPSQNYLAKGVPFAIGVNFQITGEGDGLYPEPITAIAQFSMRNRLSGETIALGTAQGQIHPQDVGYLQSPPATLTSPGIYQLQAVITLQGQEAVAGYRELQLVKVL